MDIKVGEYVRTDKGNIGRVYEIRLGKSKEAEELYFNILKLDIGLWTELSYIIKHSFNIIDLIEVGDYVNGEKIEPRNLGFVEDTQMKLLFLSDSNEVITRANYTEHIETIVTKQQFDRVKYLIKEKPCTERK